MDCSSKIETPLHCAVQYHVLSLLSFVFFNPTMRGEGRGHNHAMTIYFVAVTFTHASSDSNHLELLFLLQQSSINKTENGL
jgi:hypothetical protein